MKVRSRYQEVILRDVRSEKYDDQRKKVWRLFGFLTVALLIVYAFMFQPFLWEYGKLFALLHREYFTTTNPALKTLIYAYEYALAFVAFLGLVGVLGVLAFLAFDLQQRNEVIRRLLESQKNSTPE